MQTFGRSVREERGGAARIKFATRCLFSNGRGQTKASSHRLESLRRACDCFVARVISAHGCGRYGKRPSREPTTTSAVLDWKNIYLFFFFLPSGNLFLRERERDRRRKGSTPRSYFHFRFFFFFLSTGCPYHPRQVNGIHESSDILFPFRDGRMVASIPDDRSISLLILHFLSPLFFFVTFGIFI